MVNLRDHKVVSWLSRIVLNIKIIFWLTNINEKTTREEEGLVHATYKDKFKYVANFLRRYQKRPQLIKNREYKYDSHTKLSCNVLMKSFNGEHADLPRIKLSCLFFAGRTTLYL